MKSRKTGARIMKWSPQRYHTDPCRRPSLSASIAHVLVEQSPAHAYYLHPKLGGGTRDSTPAQDNGTLIHNLLLRAGPPFVVIDAADFRGNDAKAARDAAYGRHQVPVLRHKFEELQVVANILREKWAALGFHFIGRSEIPIQWNARTADGNVLCRSMLDHVHLDTGTIWDVKTIRNASPRQAERHFVEYGYDISYAAYTRALAQLDPEFAGRVDFVFLFMEIEPPYAVLPARPDGALREIGAHRWERAVQLWHDCLTSGRWPGYNINGEPTTLNAMPWDISRELEHTESA